MSDSTISQLPQALSVSATDVIPIDQGGVTKRTTLGQLGTGTVFTLPGKSLTINATLTFTGTDGTTITFPATSATMARTDAAQSFTGLQTFTNGLTTPAQYTSTVATGTAPFVVASTTPVINLSIGGNAATSTLAAQATALQNARTIDGVSFDGTANITVIAPGTHVAPSKTTPVDADELPLVDSAATNTLAKLTWANLKATAKTYFDTIYAALAGNAAQVFSVGPATAAAHAVRFDQMPEFPFRNRIINSDMSVSQVNGGTAVTPTAGIFVTDQWNIFISQASKLTFQQVADAPAGLKYSTKISVASQFSPGAADYFQFSQAIEGQNIIDFQLGVAGAATIITSQWIKGSVAGTYPVALINGASNRSYVGTVNVTTGWQRLSISLVGDITGTWATDNTAGLYLRFDLGSGANYNSTAGSWQTGLFTRTSGSVTFVNQINGSTLNITGVQVEAVPAGATQPTAYEFLPYETQLRRAQRYLPCFNSTGAVTQYVGVGGFYSTSQAAIRYQFKVQPRVPPTGLVTSAVGGFTLGNAGSIVNSLATSITLGSGTSTEVANMAVTGTGAPYTAQQPAELFNNSASGQLYFTGAQL